MEAQYTALIGTCSFNDFFVFFLSPAQQYSLSHVEEEDMIKERREQVKVKIQFMKL